MRESWWERENKSERERENEREGGGERESWEKRGEGEKEIQREPGERGRMRKGEIYVVRDDAHSSTCSSRDVLYILLCGPLFQLSRELLCLPWKGCRRMKKKGQGCICISATKRQKLLLRLMDRVITKISIHLK